MTDRDKFIEELPNKIAAMAITIEEKIFEQLKGYPMAVFLGQYDNLEEYIKDHPYPLSM